MNHLRTLAIVVVGCFSTSAMAQAPADALIAEFYCTGEAWGLGGGTDSVETDAYLRVSSKNSRLEISGFGVATTSGPLRAANAITRSGTVRLVIGADNSRQRDVSFSFNRFTGQLTVFPMEMQPGDKILFNGICKPGKPLLSGTPNTSFERTSER